MRTNVCTGLTGDSLAYAQEVMRSNALRFLPVVDDDGKFAGLVSLETIRLAVRYRNIRSRISLLTREGRLEI